MGCGVYDWFVLVSDCVYVLLCDDIFNWCILFGIVLSEIEFVLSFGVSCILLCVVFVCFVFEGFVDIS